MPPRQMALKSQTGPLTAVGDCSVPRWRLGVSGARTPQGSHPMCFDRHILALSLSLAASPALAFSDATAIPPPPYLVQPVMVLLVFLVIFVGAAWSLSMLMRVSSRPIYLKLWWRRLRR